MAIKFNFFQQLFAMTPPLLRHSYSLAKGCLFFLAGISFLVLTACAGGGGGSGSSGSSASAFEVELTFAPIENGFRISNQSDFGDFVVLRITATSGENVEEEEVKTADFVNDSYDFTGLLDLDWKFEVIGILSDGGEREIVIDFVWADNKADHNNGGIRPGANHDGDGRADSEDPDDDNDGVEDGSDGCRTGETDWMSNSSTDHDNDGCRDAGEDDDDDNDGVGDSSDDCSRGETDWTSNSNTDNDGDGCLDDSSEDTDDDNDRLADNHTREQLSGLGGKSCSLLVDCDGDTVRDMDEVAAGCVTKVDCDNDGAGDGDEIAGCILNPDCDGDGSMDGADIDDDGDGLIEIGTHQELNSVRYALNGNGSRSSEMAALNTTGCGGDGSITECSGYELVDNISLATYADDEGGKGWQPLGHDTDSATDGCQGPAFNGTFEGNGFMISDLNISRSGENCVGLFGHIAADSEIRNLTLRGDTVIGENNVGGLVAFGQGARIAYSSVSMNEIKGNRLVGGLMGDGGSTRIHSSSVSVARVIGVGSGLLSHSSISGLVGRGTLARIHSSSVVAGEVSGSAFVGGLVGNGKSGQIFSSSVVVAEVSGSDTVGGLIGDAGGAQIFSSSVVVGEISGINDVGGLVGNFVDGKVAYSYVVSGSDTAMLVGGGRDATGAASYWDSDTSSATSENIGAPQTTSALRTPDDYEGIYDTWDDNPIMFSDGAIDEPLAVWCDKDKSGSIEEAEEIDANRIWDFGDSDEYPAIRCTPISPTEWRSWWSLESGKPQLDQTLLNQELNK